jgi:hypothetical protein
MFDCAVGQFQKFGASLQVIICATAGKNHKNTREKLDEPLANTRRCKSPALTAHYKSKAADGPGGSEPSAGILGQASQALSRRSGFGGADKARDLFV